MFNPHEYVQKLNNLPRWDLVLTYAHADTLLGNITHEQLLETLKAIDAVYFPSVSTTQTNEYLATVVNRATPEALKTAKKSLKSYCEQLIYKDEKATAITPNEATAARTALPDYLTKIRPTTNEK